MSKRNALKKSIFIFLAFSSLLTILTLLVWYIFYLEPKVNVIDKHQRYIESELFNNDYSSYEELINKLDEISDISYSIESKEHSIKQNGNVEKNEQAIFSEVIKINKNKYLLKVYSNKNLNFVDLFISFFEVHAIMTIIITLSTGLMIEKIVIIPLRNILFEIKDYKFGKKPKKRKIKNEIDIIQNEFVELTDALEFEKTEQHRIISSISHDLKTPLTSVIGYSNFMKENNMSKDNMVKYNEKINLKAKNMKEILNNFDEYLVNNNSQSLKLENVCVGHLLEQLYQDYNFDLQIVNIDLVLDSNCKEEILKVDINKLKRIFSNVIDNSVRYMNNKGIIKINIDLISDDYIFVISDSGKGVDELIIDKIFDPLFTTDNSRKISGLGLSICKEFVEMHGGNIRAYNNKGLTIEFTIPKE